MASLKLNGDTSGEITISAPAVAGTNTLTLPAETGTIVTNVNGDVYPLTLGTAVPTTSGTSIDITGIPSWVKRVTLIFNGVNNSTGNPYLIQLGDSGGIETTGYLSNSIKVNQGAIGAGDESTAGFICLTSNVAAADVQGLFTFVNVSGNEWVLNYCVRIRDFEVTIGGGAKALSGQLDRIRVTTESGTATFSEGQINILYD